MNYRQFEDLPVWQAARDLAIEVFQITRDGAFSGFGSLRDQLERAALSVSSNIAEGFERGTNNELINFLYISRGSAGEVRSILTVVLGIAAFNPLRSRVEGLRAKAANISRQLSGWISSLKNSDQKGQKFVNQKTRLAEERARDRKDALNELRKMREDAASPTGTKD